MLHIRVPQQLHHDVKKLAEKMGVSMSLVAESMFIRFLEDRRIVIDDSYTPSASLKKLLDYADTHREDETEWTTTSSTDELMKELHA